MKETTKFRLIFLHTEAGFGIQWVFRNLMGKIKLQSCSIEVNYSYELHVYEDHIDEINMLNTKF